MLQFFGGNCFIESFNNREIAIVLWHAVLAVVPLSMKSIRNALPGSLPSLVSRKMLTVLISMFLYVGLIALVLHDGWIKDNRSTVFEDRQRRWLTANNIGHSELVRSSAETERRRPISCYNCCMKRSDIQKCRQIILSCLLVLSTAVVVLAPGCGSHSAIKTNVVIASLSPVKRTVPSGIRDDSPILGFCAVNQTMAWACGTRGTIKKTTDGSTWVTVLSNGESDLCTISADRTGDVWTAGQDGCILRSLNGGRTWNRIGLRQPDLRLSTPDIRVIDKMNVWFLDGGGRVLRTEDGGKTWYVSEMNDNLEGQSPPDSFDLIAPCGTKICWAYAQQLQGSYIYRTLDGGKSWKRTSNHNFMGITDIVSGGSGLAFVIDGKESDVLSGTDYGQEPGDPLDVRQVNTFQKTNELLVTQDGGKTWSNPLLKNLTNIALVDNHTLWALLPGYPRSHVLRTVDAGRRWTESVVDIPACRLSNKDNLLMGPSIAGVNGSCAWVTGTSTLWWATAITDDGGSSWAVHQN